MCYIQYIALHTLLWFFLHSSLLNKPVVGLRSVRESSLMTRSHSPNTFNLSESLTVTLNLLGSALRKKKQSQREREREILITALYTCTCTYNECELP